MADLLFCENTGQGKIEKRTICDLLLDRLVDIVCPDIKKAQAFIDILSKPLLTTTAIKYRQDILKDFLENPELLPELLTLFGKFREIKNQFDESRKTNKRYFNDSISRDDVQGTRNLLKINALLLKRILILLDVIRKKLDEYMVHSSGLESLKKEIAAIVLPEEYQELLELCSYFEFIGQSDPFCVQITVNDRGRICECHLAGAQKAAKYEKSKKIHTFFTSKKDISVEELTYFQRRNDTTFQEIFIQSYKEIINVLEKIYLKIESSFSGCYIDCQYYVVAVNYCRFLIKSRCQLLYPQISSDDEQSMIGLKDLFLVLQEKNADKVVANDFKSFSGDIFGMTVLGKNSGGKTVYIRSIGIAQILAQAGLPIVAELASIHCYQTIITQFSESEKYDAHSNAGRFEQEVSEMSRLLDGISKNSLVLLNEVFQSTSYDEGAECLSNILNFLSSIQAKWILVTHLKQIRTHLPTNSVFLQVKDGYKIY